MENLIYYTNLYDYYKKLLTDTQREYFEDYYFNNLSLQEIASSYNVSKNAISKTLIEVTVKLDDYENKLKLFNNKNKIIRTLEQEAIKKIEDYI